MSSEKRKKDKSTIFMLLAALLLLALVILFFQKDLIISLFSHKSTATGANQERINPPRIERIGDIEEPRIPETVPETETVLQTEATTQDIDPSETGSIIRTPVYFITVTDDGVIHLKSVIRSITQDDKKIKQAIEILMTGPETGEINKGLFTMIPKNSKLLSIQVRDRIAICDFNEDFQFNDLGREGYIAQLAQIVFTLTEFEDIDSVQILIEGKKRDYLGADGIAINEPLSRKNF